MKVFLVETTTDNDWEVVGGVQVICAESKSKALSLVKLNDVEKITSFNEIKLVTGIAFKQDPQII